MVDDRVIGEIIAALTTPLEQEHEPGLVTGKVPTEGEMGYPVPWEPYIMELGPLHEETIQFTGDTYDEAYQNLQDSFLLWGWGDGFPVVPPTRERVDAMLSGTSHAPDELMGSIWPSMGRCTVEKVAIQAVMAGAKPSYFPAILAAADAMIRAGQGFMFTQQTTSPTTPFFLINGPAIQEMGINYGMCTLGPGAPSRANIAIGRAARLIMMNIGGGYVGVKDMDTIGQAGKFSLVTAEDEEHLAQLGWEPYHVQKGFAPTESTLTMWNNNNHTHVISMSTGSARGVLMAMASGMSWTGGINWQGGVSASALILMSGDLAQMCIEQGLTTQEDIANFMYPYVKADRESFIEYFSAGEEVYNWSMEAFEERWPVGDIYATNGQNITVLRVGSMAGKEEVYEGGGKPTPVSIDYWR